MPELPEVETIRLQLQKFLVGKKIAGVEIKTAKSFVGDPETILDTRILDTRRFGKVLVIDLDNGYSLLIHLKLTGQLLANGPIGVYTRVIVDFDGGDRLVFNDLRIFGWIRIVESGQVTEDRLIGKLGPEPLKDLTLDLFKKILSKTRRPVKIVLMDQAKISGIGNIYANDALWQARIDPRRKSSGLSSSETKTLYSAILKVLESGIKYGGASDQFYVKPDGSRGRYQDHFLVYDREGKPCTKCGQRIKKFFLAGRGTYWCPRCQK